MDNRPRGRARDEWSEDEPFTPSEQADNVAFRIAHARECAHAGNGRLGRHDLAAGRLDLLERLVHRLHACVNDWVGRLLGALEKAAVDSTRLFRRLFVVDSDGFRHHVAHLRHVGQLPAKDVRVERHRPLLVVERDLEVHDLVHGLLLCRGELRAFRLAVVRSASKAGRGVVTDDRVDRTPFRPDPADTTGGRTTLAAARVPKNSALAKSGGGVLSFYSAGDPGERPSLCIETESSPGHSVGQAANPESRATRGAVSAVALFAPCATYV